MESTTSDLAAQKVELEKELAIMDERLRKTKDDEVNEEVDTVYKILRFKDPHHNIDYIYNALGRDPPEVQLSWDWKS